MKLINGRFLKANLSWIQKKSNSSDAKFFFRLCLQFSFIHRKPDFRYSSL